MNLPAYSKIPIQECGEPLVDLATRPFILEPVLFRLGLSKNPQIWARQSVANKLEQAQEEFLIPQGKRFKILDAWHSRVTQAGLYNACKKFYEDQHPGWDEARVLAHVANQVSEPGLSELVPSHATGGAIDVIVHDEHSGEDVDMGEKHYLDWREDHAPLDTDRHKLVEENHRFLSIALQTVGFSQDVDTWWHFDYGNQKWAQNVGAEMAIYDELHSSMNFDKKAWAYGHGMLLPFELK